MTNIFDEVALSTRAKVQQTANDNAPAVLATPEPGLALPMVDTPELRAAIEESAIIVLLPTLVHITGDESWLDRAAPHIQPLGLGGAQIPADLDREIRDALLAALTGPARDLPPVSTALMKRIATVLVAEPVTDEFVPLLIEQMGFQPAGDFVPEKHRPAPAGFRVAIIGAGLAGMASAIHLAESGYEYRIFEREEEVGGVWNSNRYPGVGVDTPSHFYSYSFHLNPDWPSYFSDGAVLMDYWREVAEKYQLREHISFRTTVEACVFDSAAGLWTVTTVDADGNRETGTYNAVISATGLFNNPAMPNVPGIEDFRGVAVHTANWDPAIDVTGKRVIQIGTGASGLQAGPVIARTAEHLTVFQRTAPWIIMLPEGNYKRPTAESFRWALRHIPHFEQWMRFYTYWNASDGNHRFIMQDPNWPKSDTSVNAYGEAWRQQIQGMIETRLAHRPDLIKKVIPNFPVFGKRVLQDSYWFDMLQRDNVDLVTDGIEKVTEDGILGKDGKFYPADIILYATGFAMTKMMQHVHVEGQGGTTLRELWGEEDPIAYLGTMVPGFPNFFIMGGPNFGPTHGAGNNVYTEAQVQYVMACLDVLTDKGAKTLVPSQEATDEWNRRVEEALSQTVWVHPNVTTYYRNSKGRNFISCPWRIVDMWHMLRKPELDDMIVQ